MSPLSAGKIFGAMYFSMSLVFVTLSSFAGHVGGLEIEVSETNG